MAKVPVGHIPAYEALERLREDLEPTAAQNELMRAVTSGALTLKIHDNSRELAITRGQLESAFFPERVLAKGPLEDFRDGPLTEYRGLYPYLEEAAFETWRKKLLAAEKESSTVAAETKCRVWLIDQMQNGARARNKEHYLKEAQKIFSVSQRAFNRSWKAAIAETGRSDWSKQGRPRKT